MAHYKGDLDLQQIIKLSEQGMRMEEIAKKLSLTIDEVAWMLQQASMVNDFGQPSFDDE